MANVEINDLAARTPAGTDEVEVQQTAGGASGKSTWAQVLTYIQGAATAFATAAQGSTADTAVQPGGALGTPSSGGLANCTGYAVAASPTVVGVVELATTAEIDTATDATRPMTPDTFNSSDWGLVYAQVECYGPTIDTAVANGVAYFVTPSALAGYDLVEAQANVITAGTTNTTDIQIHNLTQAADILSTVITIASGALSAADGVIDTAQDDITAGDVLRIDVDAISTTAAKGLIVTLGFRKP